MSNTPSHPLNSNALHDVFIEQLCILYNAKVNLIRRLPDLITQATFPKLKTALQQNFDDTEKQMIALKKLFDLLQVSWLTHNCLGMKAVIDEAHRQVSFHEGKNYEGDMSILVYMSVVENLQIGAMKILTLMAKKIGYEQYAALVLECLETSEENATLFHFVSEEYLQAN